MLRLSWTRTMVLAFEKWASARSFKTWAYMVEIRGSRWTPQEDALLRRMAEANVRPEIIAIKLNRTVHAVKARAYMIGLPLKWFKKAKGKWLQRSCPMRKARAFDAAKYRNNPKMIAKYLNHALAKGDGILIAQAIGLPQPIRRRSRNS